MFVLAWQPLPAREIPIADEIPCMYDNLGDSSMAITINSEQAQAYFDQGMRLAYSFAWADVWLPASRF
jgi:hypothetical protein